MLLLKSKKQKKIRTDWLIDIFEESVPMSTYLVAFVVSNYKSIKANSTRHRIEVEVAARPSAIENNEGDYALKEAGMILDYFSDYFQVGYPLPKSSR